MDKLKKICMIAFRLSEHERILLYDKARESNRSVSNMIRTMILYYLKKQ